MKKRKLNINKLNLIKEVISNLDQIKGGDGDKTGGPCYTNDPDCKLSHHTGCETIINCNGTEL